MKYSEMNQNQKACFRQVVDATEYVIGGYENELENGNGDPDVITEMPNRNELKAEIYYELMNSTFERVLTNCGIIKVRHHGCIKEIRFCTKEWIKERIEKRLTKEGY